MEKFNNLEKFMKKYDNLEKKEIWAFSSEKSAFSSCNMSEFSSSAYEKFDSLDKERVGQFRPRGPCFQV